MTPLRWVNLAAIGGCAVGLLLPWGTVNGFGGFSVTGLNTADGRAFGVLLVVVGLLTWWRIAATNRVNGSLVVVVWLGLLAWAVAEIVHIARLPSGPDGLADEIGSGLYLDGIAAAVGTATALMDVSRYWSPVEPEQAVPSRTEPSTSGRSRTRPRQSRGGATTEPTIFLTTGWSNRQRTRFTRKLLDANVPHQWRGSELLVESDYAQLVGGWLGTSEDGGAAAVGVMTEPTTFVTTGWSKGQRARLTRKLLGAGVPHQWHGEELLVESEYEQMVSGWLRTGDSVSGLWVCPGCGAEWTQTTNGSCPDCGDELVLS